LTSTNHESIVAIEEFILPMLKDGTIVREIGCWNGEALIRLAFAASERNISLAALSGVDLNRPALQLGTTFLHYLKVEDIILGVGNAVNKDIFTKTLSSRQQMILAFRLIPALDEETIDLFFSNLQSNTKPGDLACFSYALPLGDRYEEALKQVKENNEFRKEIHQKSKEGLTVYRKDDVFQTYHTSKNYEQILMRHQFHEIHSKLHNDRMISLFQRVE